MEDNKRVSLGVVAATICELTGVASPKGAMAPSEELLTYAEKIFNGEKADRIFMYNPDAIGQWLYEKYPQLFRLVKGCTDIEVPFLSPMPPKTPVCFATMYTGAQPEVHGIQKYEKYPLPVDTIFDALLRAGKRPAIVASETCTVGVIFKERNIDYYTVERCFDNVSKIHAKVAELIMEDKHDVIVVHAFNYDSTMHRTGTESIDALSEIHLNSAMYSVYDKLVREHWKGHNVFMGFAMDHGCHDTEDGKGDHGFDIPVDRNITHFYKAYKKEI